MSRFRLPARVAPSPAAEEPGLQNSAARLRSSREVQSRILAERRAPEAGPAAETAGTQLPDLATSHSAEAALAGKREGEGDQPSPLSMPPGAPAAVVSKPRKEKLVVLFRLPLETERRLEQIPGAGEVTSAISGGDGTTLALGYLHRTVWDVGGTVTVDGRSATVRELPW